MFKPGAATTFYENTTHPARIEGLNDALDSMTAQNAELAESIADARTGIAQGVANSDADALARDVAASIEGTFSIVVQAGFVRAMAQTSPAVAKMLQTAQMHVTLPGGSSVEMPVLIAAAVHSLTVVSAGEKLRTAGPARDMTGRYVVTTQGECAVADGLVTMTQKDFVLESAADSRLALYGTIGSDRIYLVANEQRYAEIVQPAQGDPQIEVPDRPSDLFEATVPAADEPMTFTSIIRGTCSFTLAPAT